VATRSPVHRLARQHPRQHKPNCDAPSRSPRQQTARRDLVPALKVHPAVLLFADFDVSKVA